MKRTERHHLKDNEFVNLASGRPPPGREQRPAARGPRRRGGAGHRRRLGYFAWRERAERERVRCLPRRRCWTTRGSARRRPRAAPPSGHRASATPREKAQAQLTKFKAAADAYPVHRCRHLRPLPRGRHAHGARHAEGSRRGVSAGHRSRRATASTGRWRGSGSPKRRRASGQFDQAIDTFKELSQRKDGPLPVDGVLMQLGASVPRCRQDDRRASRPSTGSSRNFRFAVHRRRRRSSSTRLKKTLERS